MKPNVLTRIVRWRRESGVWVYFMLTLSWTLMTLVVDHATGWGWPVYAASVAIFMLLFEVGLFYVKEAAWGSHRHLELQGLIDTLADLKTLGRDDEEICNELKISPETLELLVLLLPPPAPPVEPE